ncbi:MAG: rRNA maturation RNase YbeY, partial [Planctomycetes bacterium]|nr:rRNA maturation RNase YbeY [Planctomycetota bacterium]
MSCRVRGPRASAPRPHVSIANRQRLIPIPRREVAALVRYALAEEGIRDGVDVAFVDDAEIAALHERFLGATMPTDVITFPLRGEGPGAPNDGEREPLGEVVVSTETAIRQAPRHRSSPIRETLLYVVHGVLHLTGYDDRTGAARRRMKKRERELLAGWLASSARGRRARAARRPERRPPARARGARARRAER